MKNYLLGLVGLVLLGSGPLLAQTPTAVPYAPAPAAAAAPVVTCMPACAACVTTHAVCVPEHDVKKTTKAVYSCGCEPLCVGYVHGLFGRCGCDAGECGKPYTRHYLIKKVRTCEEDAVKCVPAEVPGCPNGR